MDNELPRPPCPWYTESHEEWRRQMRRFVDEKIRPFVDDWEEAGRIPESLFHDAAEFGLLQLGYPERYGGVSEGIDGFHRLIVSEELARSGAGGVNASLMVHGIALPPLLAGGPERLKDDIAPKVLAGEEHMSLAITEPGGGSDVAAIRTRAVADGEDYVVDGEKTYITGGMRADYFTTAVRTGDDGYDGVSLLLIPAASDGVSRTELDRKQGWWSSDTATIHFDGVRVPRSHLIGSEGGGFGLIMKNFNGERLAMAAGANASARVCIEDALAWARERRTFGRRLVDHQVIRHKIVEMMRKVNATQAYLEQCTWRVDRGETPAADLAMLKVQATLTMEFCAREAMQILGGAGYIRGSRIERIYREVRVNAIGGGSEEIMRDLAARQLGL
ncbi:MAG: acyl-CoA dehydrogenase family protein [Gammaproteobacteria bacterium]|jgi:acyl-CoA dehydrogenase